MAAGDATGAFFSGHFKGITDHLFATRACDETATQCYIMCEHVFDPSVSILDIFAYDREVDRNTGLRKNRIDSVERLKNPLVGIGVPGFTSGDIHTFHTLAFGRFHRAFE